MEFVQTTLAPSLDSKLQNSPQVSPWSAKQKRDYQRLLSGIRRAKTLGKPLRFMTLTSSPKSSWAEINAHFGVLVKRIRRRFGEFEYFKEKTREGHGVLHIVYRGAFIPQRWLSRNWHDIHGAQIVDIRKLRGSAKALARYLISAYLAGQHFLRMSWSWGWVFRGFVRFWKRFVRTYGYPLCIRHWTAFLSSKILFWKQQGLLPHLGSKTPYPWVRHEPRVLYDDLKDEGGACILKKGKCGETLSSH